MKKRYQQNHHSHAKRTSLTIVVIILCVVGSGVANYLRPLPNVEANAAVLAPSSHDPTQLHWPSAGEAAVGAQGFGVLSSSGPDTPLATASVAKIIAALAILEQKPLKSGQQGPGLTITTNDVNIYNKYVAEDGSVVQITPGEQLTEYQIFQAMMLPSANNIADSAAIWTFGSLPNYVTYANQMLKRLGLDHTIVSDDASGFLPNTTSTASDLVKLGEAALQNPVLADIVSQPQADLPVVGTVHNVNGLLGVSGIIGLKTGNTDQAGGCFLFAANYAPVPNHTVTIVGAVMGAPDLQAALSESLPLLASAKKNFDVTTFAEAGQVVGSYTVPWGKTVNVISPSTVSAITWSGSPVKPTVNLDHISAATSDTTQVGTLSVHAGNVTSSNKLVLQHAIPAPSWSWRLLRNPF